MIRTFLLAILTLSALTSQAVERMNVLMIVVDDLSASTIGYPAYGRTHPSVQTPAIDRLAGESVAFTQAYANWPSCAPARHAFMSGALPEKTGYRFYSNVREEDGQNRDLVYMGEHFRNNGYWTIRLDKVFHIGRDVARSWDITEEPFGEARDRSVIQSSELRELGLEDNVRRQLRVTEMGGEKSSIFEMAEKDENGLPIDANRLTDGITKRRALELLDDLATPGGQLDAAEKPFFMAVGFRRPHLPFAAPTEYFGRFNWGEGDDNVADPSIQPIVLPPANMPFQDEAGYRQALEGYYAALAMTDDHIGDLLEKLEATGFADNTIVLLFGDHGYGLGEHNKYFAKGTPDNVGFHTPLIVRIPGGPRAGEAETKAVSLLDVYPTLVELCGLPWPHTPLDGQSLKPLLQAHDEGWEERVVAFHGDNEDITLPLQRFVWAEGWKYFEEDGKGAQELFAVGGDDRFEWANRINDPDMEALQARLKQRMDTVMGESLARTPPKILQHPVSQVVQAGASTVLTVRASDKMEMAAQWFKDGRPIAGANGTSLLLEKITPEDAGIYACLIWNAIGRSRSLPAQIKVETDPSAKLDWMIDDTEAPFIIDGRNGTYFVDVQAVEGSFRGTLHSSYYSRRDGYAYVRPGLPLGVYSVYSHTPIWRGATSAARHIVHALADKEEVTVNQAAATASGWNKLGTFTLGPVSQVAIHMRTTEERKYVALDGMRFERQGGAQSPSAPVVVDDGVHKAAIGQTIEIDVLANDSDPDGAKLRFYQVSGSLNGRVGLNKQGRITFTPFAGTSGRTEVIRYQITNGKALSAPASFTITVE